MKNLLATAGLAALISAAVVSQAHAQPSLGSQNQRDAGGAFGAFADAVIYALTPDEVRQLPVDDRQAWIDHRISSGVRDGTLTRAEAGRLREQFAEINRLELTYRRGGISRWERADLDRRFDELSRRVYNERHDRQERWASIDARQRQLDARIDAGVRSGDLTSREADNLRQEFRALARLEARYRVGGLTISERVDLDRRFDVLARQVARERRDSPTPSTSIDARQARLFERIDDGVRDRQLTGAEADRLRDEYRELARLEARYSVGGLSVSERTDLDRRFDALSGRIREERRDSQTGRGWVSINERQQELDRRIDAGVRDGSLTAREAEGLRAELRSLARLERQYRRGGLSVGERAELDRRLDALRNQIRSERYDRQAQAR